MNSVARISLTGGLRRLSTKTKIKFVEHRVEENVVEKEVDFNYEPIIANRRSSISFLNIPKLTRKPTKILEPKNAIDHLREKWKTQFNLQQYKEICQQRKEYYQTFN